MCDLKQRIQIGKHIPFQGCAAIWKSHLPEHTHGSVDRIRAHPDKTRIAPYEPIAIERRAVVADLNELNVDDC